ncbi:Methionine--tRNA ligase [wastewater metagenome]|uniref:Methionine--tRNA ligase n=2 Tax=unclassified sequences TaxID=12908 RepID=A0A5B8RLP5_9ZZZZ|nr:methionine--tRNA ligase [uncultured organism]
MVSKYFDGTIPAYKGNVTAYDQELKTFAEETIVKVEKQMEELQFSVALSHLWELIRRTNKYIDETEPWKLAKDDSKRDHLASVMVHLSESLRSIAVMLQPFMTSTPQKIFGQLGMNGDSLKNWDSLNTFGVSHGNWQVQKGQPLFPRLDVEEEVQYILDKMHGNGPSGTDDQKEKQPETSEETAIDINDFGKVDLRVGTVIEAAPVKKTDKLLKLQLDMGAGQKRQVVSGIAEHYQPDDLVGQKVIVVANLKPVKLRGETSEGMILAGEEDGVLKLASVDGMLPNGTKIK